MIFCSLFQTYNFRAHLTLTLPLSTQVYKWILTTSALVYDLSWTEVAPICVNIWASRHEMPIMLKPIQVMDHKDLFWQWDVILTKSLQGLRHVYMRIQVIQPHGKEMILIFTETMRFSSLSLPSPHPTASGQSHLQRDNHTHGESNLQL